MYDELYNEINIDFSKVNNSEDYKQIINLYNNRFLNINDDKENWFVNIKKLSDEVGFASDMKIYKENPSAYRWSVADISNIIRVALTGKDMTPDLYQIMKLLGKEKIKKRFEKVCG